MKNEQKIQIAVMRLKGHSYSKIATQLSVSENTVKSYCRRNSLNTEALSNVAVCKQCYNLIALKDKCKPRKFCSDWCRLAWWNEHHSHSGRRTIYQLTCVNCGTNFESDSTKSRKFCSHKCYIAFRFGKERVSDE